MATLKDYMIQILESRDFSVEEREGYIYGRREDVAVVIMAASALIADDAEDFVRNVSTFQGRKVVASLGPIDENIQGFLQSKGVHYWGREEIEHELGNMQLETVSSHRGGSLIDEIISDELPQKPSEPHDHAVPFIVESANDQNERIVKPNFTLDDVKHLARHDIMGYKYELELVPHYLFHYVLNIGEGKQKAGIAAVNALTSHVETWRWGFELVDSIELTHSKREPKIDYEKAKSLANEMITREHKSHSETVRDFGHSEIIERKKSHAEPVVIEPKGLVYLPVWCVEGTRGAMIINSSSGKVISEHIHAGDQAAESRLG